MPKKATSKTVKRGLYIVTTLGGKSMTESQRAAILAEQAQSDVFRAMVQLLEEELLAVRDRACDPTSLREGTQAHWNGGVDVLNGALLRLAETVQEGLRAKKA